MPDPTPEPIRIEVPTTKVDATLDLVQILGNIASNAQSAAAPQGRRARAAALPAEATAQLSTIGDLARQLADQLSAVQSDAPAVLEALEQASADPQP
jgi:hypothetical protein